LALLYLLSEFCSRTDMKKPTPATAIITGLGVLGFGALYFLTGIFPSRTTWSPDRVVTAAENPIRFGFAIFVTFVAGGASLIWGILNSKK
jgi:hypothetical protein